MTDYPAMFEPKEKLVVSLRLPMVRLTFQACEGVSLRHSFGNKPLVKHDDEPMFAELAIRSMVDAKGWEARCVCTYGAKAKEPRYLKSWCDDALDHQKDEPLDTEREVLLDKIAKQNHNSYAGCWDVLAWKDDRTLFHRGKARQDGPHPGHSPSVEVGCAESGPKVRRLRGRAVGVWQRGHTRRSSESQRALVRLGCSEGKQC